MASGIYNNFKGALMKGNTDLESNDIKVMLLDSNHSFTATDSNKSDVDSNEISGTGYTAGGKSLSNKAVTTGATTDFDADDVEWSSATFSASHAVLYDDSSGSDILLASIDFGGSQSVSSGTFKIEWHSDGIITLT